MSRAKQLAERRTMLVTECALQRLTFVAQFKSSHSDNSRSAMFLAAIEALSTRIPVKLISVVKIALNVWKLWR